MTLLGNVFAAVVGLGALVFVPLWLKDWSWDAQVNTVAEYVVLFLAVMAAILDAWGFPV